MEQSISLKQIQLKLNVPQHVLIHLCEKGVVTPAVTDTKGRGQWRKFSRRNLFEFAVALELRKYQIPILVVRAIIELLAAFERSAQSSHEEFSLPESLTRGPDLVLHIYDGEKLVFALGNKVLLASDFLRAVEGAKSRLERINKLPTSYKSYLSINLSKLAEQTSDS